MEEYSRDQNQKRGRDRYEFRLKSHGLEEMLGKKEGRIEGLFVTVLLIGNWKEWRNQKRFHVCRVGLI